MTLHDAHPMRPPRARVLAVESRQVVCPRRGIVDLEEALRRDPRLADDIQPALERAYQLRDAAQAAEAAISSSRIATQARPRRESRSRAEQKTVIMTSASAVQR